MLADKYTEIVDLNLTKGTDDPSFTLLNYDYVITAPNIPYTGAKYNLGKLDYRKLMDENKASVYTSTDVLDKRKVFRIGFKTEIIPLLLKAFQYHNINTTGIMTNTGKLISPLEQQLDHVIKFVLHFPNPGYTILPNLLNFINPGWGINWHMENVVEQEGIIMARPGCYTNVSTLPTTVKQSHNNINTSNVDYVYQYNTAIHQMSLNHGAIIDPNAYAIKFITRPTAHRIGPVDLWTNSYNVDKIHSLLYSFEENCNSEEVIAETSPWIPLITTPFCSTNYWGGTGQSPVGRYNGHYESEEDFHNRFFDLNEMDIRVMDRYTMNPVWINMYLNINTVFLIPPNLFENSRFIFYKYLHFNPISALCVNQIKQNYSRKNHKNENDDFDNFPNSMNTDQHSIMKYISASRSIIFNKMCATTTDQLCPAEILEGQRFQRTGVCKNLKNINANYDYKISGNGAFEKFDKIGVNHNTFY